VEREGLSQGGFKRGHNTQRSEIGVVINLTRWPKVEDLRAKLNDRAKAEPKFRFYSLYDKVYRMDFLEAAYAQCKSNAGAPGVDGKTFADIESCGVERFLRELADELKELKYRPQPVRRVLIPKENQPGKFRPLGIPTIKDRIVQQVVKLLLEPIFEADFTDNAYGYRPDRSAQDAVRDVHQGLLTGWTEVVDADLSKYFDTIPHHELMQSVERRVADHKVLWMIRAWLKAPVHETNANGKIVVTGGKKTKQGTPQGGVISPLLANIYFRRFLKAWSDLGYERKFKSRIVNYADDFVILTRYRAKAALEAARRILTQMGLTLNETKTRTVHAWENSFDFLGYTFGKRHLFGTRRSFLAPAPSAKSMKKYREKIRQQTASSQTCESMEAVAEKLNRITRGFWNYFCQGMSFDKRHDLNRYLWDRMRKWAYRKYRKLHGASQRQQAQAAKKLLVLGHDIPQRRWSANAARFVTVLP
jgi:RNA-directed DNA polymerase